MNEMYDVVAEAAKAATGKLDVSPEVAALFEERSQLAADLYRLALALHCPSGQPCDDDIECQDCTLLLIASEELGLPEPWPTPDVQG